MKHRSAIIAAVVGVALAALVALFALAPSGDEKDVDTSGAVVDELAAPVKGTTITGEEYDLDDRRGRWVLVNFFATWCPPCVQEQPELVAFASRNAEDAEIVSVAFDDRAEKVEAFFAESGATWPVLAQDTGEISIDYGVVKLPESFLVNPEGQVVEKFTGGLSAAEVEAVIARESGGSAGGSGSGGS